jgi:triosephosphate isomerase (TIM)
MVIIAGNWKMNKTIGEAISLVKELKKLVDDSDNEIIISPAFTALSAISAELKGSNIKLCAQNMHFSKEGAFTGEISASMLKEIGVEYVILGHSERRHVFNENNALINKKVKTALSNGLKPILCVGETLEEREKGRMKDVVVEQINKGLDGIKGDLIVAYEPVWAIGTGKTATPQQAEEAHMFIRGLLGDDIPILYGGSVKPDNIKELIAQKNIDGVLVGGASLDAKSFSEIVKC